MKKLFILLYFFSGLAVTLLSGGCATAKIEKTTDVTSQTTEERIVRAEAEKTRLMKQLDESESVDDSVQIKQTLSKVQAELDELQSGKKVSAVTGKTDEDKDGFKNTKDRTIVYGPVGAVLHFTEWILVKLYIMHES